MDRDATQLLASMVAIPPGDGRHLARQRLTHRLDEAAHARLVYVRAPAGFGKTSMLVHWVHRQFGSRRMAWLALDESHADPRALLRYLIAALRSCCGPVGEATLTLLNANLPVNVSSLVTTLLNELGALGEAVWLVLDDLHCVGDGEAAQCIAELIGHAPPHLHLVATSRETPPFPVGRLRQLGGLHEIGAADLEFTPDEVEAFLQHEALSLDLTQTNRLAANTGGWAAGLRLAAISMRDEASPGRFLDAFSGGHAAIAEFLQEDVIGRQSAELRAFLAESALLDEPSPALCDHALECEHSETLLEEVYERGLFLTRSAPDGSRYRYHSMFADYLRRRIRRDNPLRAARICARASDWYARRGADSDAIDYAIRSGDEARAADLLEAASERLFAAGQLEVLQAFAARLPDNVLDECPRLLLDLIWARTLSWESRAAAALMQRVQNYAARHGEVLPVALREKILHREIMMALLRDDLAAAESLWERWPAVSTGENDYFDGSAESAALIARRERFDCRFVIGQSPRVRRRFTDAGAEYGTVWFDSLIGPAILMSGESERAAPVLQAAIEVAARTSGNDAPLIAMPALLLADVHYERGELDACRVLTDTWLPRADRIGFADQLVAGYVCAIRLAALAGDDAEAFRLLSRGEAQAVEYGFERLGAHLASERVALLLTTGRAREARGQLKSDPALQRSSLTPGKFASVSDAVVAIAHARVAHGTATAPDAIRVLRAWVNYVEGHGCVRHAIRLRTLLATLLHAANEPAEAWRVLRLAIEQSRTSGIVQPFVEEGARVLSVLDFAAAENGQVRGALAATVATLRSYLAGETDEVRVVATPRVRRQGIAIDPLTQRQREILVNIADGSSNKEVAAQLGVSEATVKWHLRLVYDKLGVHRRVAAVREARALGLIP